MTIESTRRGRRPRGLVFCLLAVAKAEFARLDRQNGSEVRVPMRRRQIVHLLIVLILQPWLSCAHAHAEISEHDPSGKLRAPHFHLRFLFAFWRQPADLSAPTAQHAMAMTGGAAARDHDLEALYIPVSILLGWDDGHDTDVQFLPVDLALSTGVGSRHGAPALSLAPLVLPRVDSTYPTTPRTPVLLV